MELKTIYDTRKSFYGKATTETQRTPYEITVDLYSYNTLVGSVITNIEKKKITYKYLGAFSQTTTRHQKEFFKQQGLYDNEIKELFKNKELVKDL